MRVDLLRADQQRLKNALRESSLAEHLFDGKRALRHVRGMLQQADITRHQGRSGKADHLPERKIPRHHCQYRPDGQISNKTLLRSRVDHFVGQKPLGVLGVVPAGSGALECLGDRGLKGLAHLQRHQLGIFFFVPFENLRCLQHAFGALGERSLPLTPECCYRQLQLLLDFSVREWVESLDQFAGGRIDGGNGHERDVPFLLVVPGAATI